MTVLEYLKHIGKHDGAKTQIIWGLALFAVVNLVLGVLLIWPMHRHQQALNQSLQKTLQIAHINSVMLNQSEAIKARYDNMMRERVSALACDWTLGKETDTIDLNFEQAHACLEAWIQDNHHNITEITFYKNGKVRTIEVMHD